MKFKNYAVALSLFLMAANIIGCSNDKKADNKAAATKQTQQVQTKELKAPAGYKIVKSEPEYIKVTSIETNSVSGGPKLIYDKDAISFCATTINSCTGKKRTIIGGFDGETVTIYKSGKVSVDTVIGSKVLRRFYNSSSKDVLKYSMADLVAFKIDGRPDGWKRVEGKTSFECVCGKEHKIDTAETKGLLFAATTKQGMQGVLDNKWKQSTEF